MRTAVILIQWLVPEKIRKHRVFAQFVFYPSLLYNILMKSFTNRNWYDRIDDTVVLGALPFHPVASRLIEEERIKAVVSMNEDFELKFLTPNRSSWSKRGVEFLQLPTQDIFAAPEAGKLREGVDLIQRYREQKSSVYVHCKAGRTRSATLVGCYLMERHGYGPEKCYEEMRRKRPHVLLEEPQWEALRLHFERFVKPKVGLDNARPPIQ
ncbi:phosphatidylglycerophosphatase and protein-tyrosine phosphatase 1 [Galendromus occidentalis]|uniref:Phosphatidylglycerophosphatase and protein-tyrosine phosphatase 1 n=1 Tax=Galendromus occidentalis TaxID=34638 RepID=A0AAJ6VXI4_9ACAR|nr:phosphatidylglycerophosphatase and protein-tyrosine phosphatase 1 [Galendromus occidentalis]